MGSVVSSENEGCSHESWEKFSSTAKCVDCDHTWPAPEPPGSASSSPDEKCARCAHLRRHHGSTVCFVCPAFTTDNHHGFVPAEPESRYCGANGECRDPLKRCGLKCRRTAEPEHRHCPHWESDAEGDVCCECSTAVCDGCGDAAHGDGPCGAEGCLCGHPVPEPEAPEIEDYLTAPCKVCAQPWHRFHKCPGGPPRRPPYAVAYVLQDGTHFEVALPGDATVCALDGALLITHAQSPVQGLTQARPIEGA